MGRREGGRVAPAARELPSNHQPHMDTSVEVRLLPICTACESEEVPSTGMVMMEGCVEVERVDILSDDPVTSRV